MSVAQIMLKKRRFKKQRALTNYEWYADFATAVPAPIGATYVSEVGTWNHVDTMNRDSINNGNFIGNGVGAGGGDPSLVLNREVTRSGGLVMRLDVNFPILRAQIGVYIAAPTTGTVYRGLGDNGGVMNYRNAGNVVAAYAVQFVVATDYKVWMWERPTGGAGFFREESAGVIVCDWIDNLGTGTAGGTLIPGTHYRVTNYSVQASTHRGRKLGGVWADDYLLAIVNLASQASGVQAAGVAEGLFDTLYTQPGSPTVNDHMGVYYRRQGADNLNCFHAYVSRNAGNTQWDAKLDVIAAGVVTNLITVTNVLTTKRVRVIAIGNTHFLYTQNTSDVWTQRGGTITNTSFNTETGVALSYSGLFTHDRFICWAFRSTQQPLYTQLYIV